MKKMQGHNFELGADLSTAAAKKLNDDMDRKKTQVMKNIGETVKQRMTVDHESKRSFAENVSANNELLSCP